MCATALISDIDSRLEVEESTDEAPDFAEDVRRGLSGRPKHIPSIHFYDRVGSQIFEEICELPEYYPTRTELAILRQNASEIAAYSQGEMVLVELGSGSSTKTRILIEELLDRQPSLQYHPVDISHTMLVSSARELLADYPDLSVMAHVADYGIGVERMAEADYPQKLVAFLGSNIGNFEPAQRAEFLRHIRAGLRRADYFLLGTDMQKDPAVLEAAYDDSQGVTARFNLNLLQRINHELGGDFRVSRFAHRALYNAEKGRIEMRLRSLIEQVIKIKALAQTIHFEQGEEIYTESSYKFTPHQIEQIGHEGGFEVADYWTDERGYFRLTLLRPVE